MPREARLREPISLFGRAPWEDPPAIIVYLEVPGVSGRNDDTERKQALTVKQINSFYADLMICTDRSASAGMREGVDGVVIIHKLVENPVSMSEIMVRGAALTNSYEKEKARATSTRTVE